MSEAYDAYLLQWVEEERASLISSLVPSPLWLLKEAHWSLPTFLYLRVPAGQETAAAPTPITSQLVVSFTVGFPGSQRVWGGVGGSGVEGLLWSVKIPPWENNKNIETCLIS